MGSKFSAHHPVLAVSAYVRNAGRVLLVRRGRPPRQGLWSLPGGRVEFGERLAAAAIREVREETGVEIGDLKRIDVVEIISREEPAGASGHHVLIVFAARPVSTALAAGDDAAEARWVAPEEFDELPMTEDTGRLTNAFRKQPGDS